MSNTPNRTAKHTNHKPTLVSVESPYFKKEKDQEEIDRKENEVALAQLEARLDSYSKIADANREMIKWIVAFGIIITPFIIGILIQIMSFKSNLTFGDVINSITP